MSICRLAGWLALALARLEELARRHPRWMIAGPYGVRADGAHVGQVFDAGLGRELGRAGFGLAPVVSLDELLLILRLDGGQGDGFRLDPVLPHFHLYGTDMVQTCLLRGHEAFAVELPLVHNSRRVASLAGGYTLAYRHARDKWREKLPIPTTVCTLSASPWPLWRAKWRLRKVPARSGDLAHDAVELARRAGYEPG